MRWRWANYKAKTGMQMSWHCSSLQFYSFSPQPQESLRKRLLLYFSFINNYIGSSREVSITHSPAEGTRDTMGADRSPSQKTFWFNSSSADWKPNPQTAPAGVAFIRPRCAPQLRVHINANPLVEASCPAQLPGIQWCATCLAKPWGHCNNPLCNFPHWRA